MAGFSSLMVAKALFIKLGFLMLVTLIYTLITDGSPFRRELLTPWMAATLVDFYINVLPIAVWVTYKESNWISALVWILLLICFGSITTCIYVVIQLFKVSSQSSVQGPMYHCLLRDSVRNCCERQRKCSPVIVGRILFSMLGCLMLVTLLYTIITDGSPFRKELLTPWMTATLIDFYINVVAISMWVAHKESTWIGAFLWIVLLICFGAITTCVYIVIQLFKLSAEDPFNLIFVDTHGKKQSDANGDIRIGDPKSFT